MAFKMKQTPMLKAEGGLGKFFKGLLGGKSTEKRQEKQVRENQGMTNFEKRQAEKATQRKTGESKFQADTRRKRETGKTKKKTNKRADSDDVITKNIKDTTQKGDDAAKNVKKATVENKPKQTFKQAFAAARKAGKKTFSFKGKSYTTKTKEDVKKTDVKKTDFTKVQGSKTYKEKSKTKPNPTTGKEELDLTPLPKKRNYKK